MQLSANTSSDYQLKCGMLNDMLDIIDLENKYVRVLRISIKWRNCFNHGTILV